MIADKAENIGVNPPHPRHPRSINSYAGVKNALVRGNYA
jgi:hypothetical protein